MAAPTASDLQSFLGRNATVDEGQGAALISYVQQLVAAYTRNQGFAAGVPNADLSAVILGAAARIWANPRQLGLEQTEGQESVSFRGGFSGWSLAELTVLDRYRIRAL